ncbi:hypothetical protein, partial [Sphingomonas sp. 10B4]
GQVNVPVNAALVQQSQGEFSLQVFNPPNLTLPQAESEPVPSDAQLEGIALHALLERLTNQVQAWPVVVPEAEAIAAWLPCAS